MYVIAGATGHVGGHAARNLLSRGEPVRVLVRSADKGAEWAAQGAEVVIADLADQTALADAVRGSRGFFVLLPANGTGPDFHAEQRHLADSIAGAVADSDVPHVVMLSSIGADLDEGTGPLLPLHYLENQLRATGTVLSALRCHHFQEKVEELMDAVLGAGIYPVFGESADVSKPMVATRDIGAVVAETLLSPPESSQVVELEGPHYTERDVAQTLSEVLGKPVQVVTIPRDGWVGTLVEAGIPAGFAAILAELYDADERGLLRSTGAQVRRCPTELSDTVRHVVGNLVN